jgi:hypothetical protein
LKIFHEWSDTGAVLKAYAIGFLGAVLAVVIAIAVVNGLHAEEQAGLRWGGTVYTSKADFQGYLKSRGLSYETWLARNPGAAPWEPEPARRVAARTAAPADERETRAPTAPPDDVLLPWPGWWPLAGVAAVLAAASALLVSRGGLRAPTLRSQPGAAPSLRLRPRPPLTFARLGPRLDAITAGRHAALPSLRRLADVAVGATRRLEAAAPFYGERLLGGARADAQQLRKLANGRGISAGDVAFALLAVTAAVMFVVFVVVLLTA